MPSVGPLEFLVVLLIAAFWISVVGLIIYGVLALLARVGGRSGEPPVNADDPALVSLRDRFARGEIDETEYQHKRSALQGR